MSKSKKKKVTSAVNPQNQEVVQAEETTQVVETTETKEEVKVEPAKAEKAQKEKSKAKNKKKAKKDNSNSIGKKIKGTASELKKVTWPKFSEVLKQTGVVLAFVAITVVLLLGVNSLLSWIFNLLVG